MRPPRPGAALTLGAVIAAGVAAATQTTRPADRPAATTPAQRGPQTSDPNGGTP